MEHPPDLPDEMAAVVAHNRQPTAQQPPQSGPKRFRPAPAKTFQCRGYGECRMVFSRSEHLARHIRKHTGERPFTCHCSKQFSRLDNLRQHAQTVHADKQDQNERMMRDLTSLHATMAAANKLSTIRNPRRNPSHLGGASNGAPGHVKQEDLQMPPLHQRPGTSTGYEGDHDSFLYHQHPSWHLQDSKSNSSNHSFRDSNQSFLGPPATTTSPAAGAAPGQSFLPFSSSLSGFGLSDSVRDTRPRTSSSRPPTSSGLADPDSRSLPPLAAVLSASLSTSPRQQHDLQSIPAPPGSSHGQPGSSGSLLLPGSLTLRRPTTATRPGTAPASASLFSAKSSLGGGSGMALPRPELPSIQSYSRPTSSYLGAPPPPVSAIYDPGPPSPGGNDPSPFFFSPPSLDPPPTSAASSSTSPATVNPRKRPFAGSDGPYDDASSSRDPAHDYEYGSESRPQSRRLSVMELCHNSNGNAGTSTSFLLSSTRAESRPTTSGLISSASALALVDRPSPTLPSPSVQSRPSSQYPSAAAAAATTTTTAAAATTTSTSRGNGGGGGGGGQEEFGGSRISSTLRRDVPPPTSILSYRSAGAGSGGSTTFIHSPTFSTASTASYSPRSATGSPFSPRSPIPGEPISRRTHGDDGSSQHDQIRFSRASHTSPALGLRV